MNIKTLLISCLLFANTVTYAQYLSGFSTYYDDSFVEWMIFLEKEHQEDEEYEEDDYPDPDGELKMRWQMQDDWTEWDYDILEQHGSIRQKWKNDPNQWEIRQGNQVVTARTSFKNDFSRWRITNNNLTLTVETRFGNNGNIWDVTEDKDFFMEIFTAYENDPRDWEIVDQLSEEIPLAMKMAVVFLAVYHSSPRD